MIFSSFTNAWNALLLGGFLFAVLIGAVAHKTSFCTMGAVADWVNMGDKRRLRAWLLAIAVALLGVALCEWLGWVNADFAFPPYRSGTLAWGENIIGGLLFGSGMVLASGCGNRTLIRLGGGNLKSLLVLLIIGGIAFYMLNPLPNSEHTLYSLLFLPWAQHLRFDLSSAQDLGSLFSSLYLGDGGDGLRNGRLAMGLLLGGGLLYYVFKAKNFRQDSDGILGGSLIGLAVLAAWIISSGVQVSIDGDVFSLRAFYNEWDFLAAESVTQPRLGATLSPQSYTFINPLGQTLGYLASGFSKSSLTFGVVAVFGVVVGAGLWAWLSKGFRWEWFADFADFTRHLIGAIAMGFGGILALGCTIGQGISGVATLALGSLLTLVCIVFGAALTLKTQYYCLVYEQAGIGRAMVAALADLKLLPNAWRSLDKI